MSVLFKRGLQSEGGMNSNMQCFSPLALLFWLPVVQPCRVSHDGLQVVRPLYLFLATLPCDALSAFLTFATGLSTRVIVRASHVRCFSSRGSGGAGALMWVWVTFAYLVQQPW